MLMGHNDVVNEYIGKCAALVSHFPQKTFRSKMAIEELKQLRLRTVVLVI